MTENAGAELTRTLIFRAAVYSREDQGRSTRGAVRLPTEVKLFPEDVARSTRLSVRLPTGFERRRFVWLCPHDENELRLTPHELIFAENHELPHCGMNSRFAPLLI